jgi:hypothetical protein
MNATLLVRHPKRNQTESILGYLLRLSEQNGYSSPSKLLQLAGIPPGASIGRIGHLAKLAAIVNFSESEVEGVWKSGSFRHSLAILINHFCHYGKEAPVRGVARNALMRSDLLKRTGAWRK